LLLRGVEYNQSREFSQEDATKRQFDELISSSKDDLAVTWTIGFIVIDTAAALLFDWQKA